MTIELAVEQDFYSVDGQPVDDQLNERGVKDYGFWQVGSTEINPPRFFPVCPTCSFHKLPNYREGQGTQCDDCNHRDEMDMGHDYY
jgi:hypothetical protein